MGRHARRHVAPWGRGVPEDEAERTKLRARLVHAGLYQRQAMHVFLGVKLALLMLATIVGLGLTFAQVVTPGKALQSRPTIVRSG